MNKRFRSVKTKAVAVSDESWEKVKAFMVTPDKFQRDDVRIFEALLAHNFIDRDKERFSKPTLQSMADTIIGKQVLQHHAKWTDGVGRFVDAKLQKMTMDETLKLIGSQSDKKVREKLARIEQADGGLFWMNVQYYMLAKDPLVEKIDSGIIGDMSISFVPVIRKEIRQDEKDREPLWTEFQDSEEQITEAIEGSLVFLGAQPGARVRKDANGKETEELDYYEDLAVWSTSYVNNLEDNCFAYVEDTGKKDDDGKTVPRNARHLPHHAAGNGASGTGGTVDLPHLRNALARVDQTNAVTDTITTEELRAKAKAHLLAHAKKLGIGEGADEEENFDPNKNTKGREMITLKMLGAEYVVEAEKAESIEAAEKAVADAIKALTDEKEALTKQVADLEKERDENKANAEEAKKVLDTANEYKQSLVDEAIKYGSLADLIAQNEVDAKKEAFAALTIAELKEKISEYKKVFDKLNPGKSTIETTTPKVEPKNVANYIAPVK